MQQHHFIDEESNSLASLVDIEEWRTLMTGGTILHDYPLGYV